MIQNFSQWNSNRSIAQVNEGASSAAAKTLRILSQKTGKTIDEIVEGGFKGIGNLMSKFFGASSDEIAKMEKGFSKIVEIHKEPWWQSMSRSSRRNLEKEADEIGKKFIIGYHRGDDALIQAARKESKEYLSKVRTLGSSQKVIDDLTSRIDDVPRGKVRAQVKDNIKAAQQSLDDAAKTGDADKIKAARMYAKDANKTFTSAGKKSSFYQKDSYYSSRGGRNGVLGRGMEDGSDLKNIVPEELEKNGKEGFFKKILRDIFKGGKDNFDDIPKKGKTQKIEVNVKEKRGLWEGLKRNIRRFVVFSAVVAVGGIVLNFKKSDNQTKSTNSFEEGYEAMKEQLFKEGVSETEVDMNKASFAEIFRLWFSGESEDLPDDAEELKTMFEAGSTITDFFAKTSQIAFEYPEKYFKERESDFEKSSLFYGFMKKLNERVGLSKLLKTISEAGGMAERTIQDTFYVNGSPPSLEEHGYLSYNNPNMKTFLGLSDPIDASEIIDEAKDFLSVFATFKRKAANDFIQSKVSDFLREEGKMIQEVFEEKARQIELELSEKLSKKEEVFVAMTTIIMSYNAGKEPFESFYGFDSDGLSDTMDAMCSLMGNTMSFNSRNQLSRLYLSISAEFSEVYETMGKERSFYGIMEYSTHGVIMRSIMNLLALETICRMIVESSEGEFKEEYSKDEIEEYQKVIIQIQRNEGTTPTVSPSGVLDTETETAIKGFQNKFGLPETGKPGDKVLKSMKDYLLSTMTTQKT